MVKVLIITYRLDDHAHAVYECLKHKGAQPFLWFPDEYILNQKSSQFISMGEHSITINTDKMLDLIDVDVVWFRRSKFPSSPDGIDLIDREIIDDENRMHMRSLWLTLGEKAQWVNPFSSFDKSNSKPLQLREAARLGLQIPDTLISNDKDIIADFIKQNAKIGTIYKTFLPVIWDQKGNKYSCYCSEVKESILPSEDTLRLTPGIYQRKIKKQYEVRVTFFGDEYVAVKIHNSDETDWRIVSVFSKLTISPIRIPKEIEIKCISLMKQLDIVFGCFDFIVTPKDEYIFLEVNEMGQFLWKEEKLPEMHLLDKFSEFLLSTASIKKHERKHKIYSLKEYIESTSIGA